MSQFRAFAPEELKFVSSFKRGELVAEPGSTILTEGAHSAQLFTLLHAEHAGVSLTEHFAMMPAASVSGLYFANPDARYFTVGRIGRDQLADYARRKGVTAEEAERWLTPNLAYDPIPVGRC